LQHKNIVHILEKIGGDRPIGGVILLPMIPGGEIYQMKRLILEKETYTWRKSIEA
jgi:hypothetical protein